jgi:NAD(P)-dependent dehydrogenase (short-subunit alcohol dehydrogenase family)
MGLLDGKVVVITGAGGGLGREHALAMAKEGGKIVVNDLGGARDGTGAGTAMADGVVEEIKAAGGEAVASYDSVATVKGANGILQTAIDAFGQLDVCVNNAGILRDKTLSKMDEEMWDIVIAVHLRGTYCVSRAAFNHMKEKGSGGVIINTSSTSGLNGNFGQCNYGAAKAGIAG